MGEEASQIQIGVLLSQVHLLNVGVQDSNGGAKFEKLPYLISVQPNIVLIFEIEFEFFVLSSRLSSSDDQNTNIKNSRTQTENSNSLSSPLINSEKCD